MANLVNGYTFDAPPTAAEVERFEYFQYGYVENTPGYVANNFVSYAGIYYNANGTLSGTYVANNQVTQY